MSALEVAAQLAGPSPFLPPQNANSSAPTQNAPLEFRGYIETPDGVQYRIYDPARKGGVWVKLNERNPDFGVVVKHYDPDQQTVTVDLQGRTLVLEERKAKISSSGPISAVVPPVLQPMPGNALQSMVPATPADEQKRLEAVAQEVARRRALREQATSQINQGVPPGMTIPGPRPITVPQIQANGRRGAVNRQQR